MLCNSCCVRVGIVHNNSDNGGKDCCIEEERKGGDENDVEENEEEEREAEKKRWVESGGDRSRWGSWRRRGREEDNVKG